MRMFFFAYNDIPDGDEVGCTGIYPYLYFRGQNNSSWKVVPSIFRNNILREKESDIINFVFSSCPEDFHGDVNLFDKLVRMQHMGCPTRLLDVTQNPLVALFFACQESDNHKENDIVYIQYGDSNVTYPDDPIVKFKSELSSIKLIQKIKEKCK